MAYAQFNRVPNHYSGPIVQRIKDFRRQYGRKSTTPTQLRVARLRILVPRHFGFCFGVERAIHMAFSAVASNPGRRTYLVSEIIHNPLVNGELAQQGVRFLFGEGGVRQVPQRELGTQDVVLIPAFGTTLDIEASLASAGIDTSSQEFRQRYDTTCPFVSKVWKRGRELGAQGYTIVIHGKFRHEETQATQSHIQQHARTLVVLDRTEAMFVADFIADRARAGEFGRRFAGKASAGFDPEHDLQRVAVVNQTTMLADETREVCAILREALRQRYGSSNLDYHWADTSDTLCYATNQNQSATRAAMGQGADLALVVGGYNSSNTAHLLEICADAMPSYLIANAGELLSRDTIRHFDPGRRETVTTQNWLPDELPADLVVTSGASCPDVLMNQVIEKVAGYYGYDAAAIDAGLEELSLAGDDE